MVKHSAGVVLWRTAPVEPLSAAISGETEILVVHPGGPFWAGKNEHGWSIPKGEFNPAEEAAEACARREFAEELGQPLPAGTVLEALGIVKASGKHIYPFLGRGNFDPARLQSNTTIVQWPPRSGKSITIPEIDAAAWIPLTEVQRFLHKGQAKVPVLVQAALGRDGADTWPE